MNNNTYSHNRRILIFSLLIGFIILIAAILIIYIFQLRRSATLDILVAPTSATITRAHLHYRHHHRRRLY